MTIIGANIPEFKADPEDSLCTVSRHDPHNVDLRFTRPCDGEVTHCTTEVFLFVPPLVSLSRWDRAELQKDFHSRLRLSLVDGAHLSSVTRAVRRLRRILEALESVDRDEARLNSALVEAAKELGALASDALLRLAGEQRQLVLALSSSDAPAIQDRCLVRLRISLRQVRSLITEIRRDIPSASAAPTKVLDLLDEYLSHLYVQCLGRVRGAVEALPDRSPAAGRVDRTLTRCQRAESAHRRRFLAAAVPSDPMHREQHVVRMSHLKKFFQSRMFIDVSSQPLTARVIESSAALGAFGAGLVGMFAERLGHGGPLASATHGVWLLMLPALAYALRDRIKDWAKHSLQARARRWFPDAEKTLFADGRRLGLSREWFKVMPSGELPPSVLDARQAGGEFEGSGALREDVLYFRQEQTLDGEPDEKWSLCETLRLNLERYLKYLDDPFKEMAMLAEDGNLVRLSSRRVYHFHLCIVAPSRKVSAYRVVVDKRGVDRVEWTYGPQ